MLPQRVCRRRNRRFQTVASNGFSGVHPDTRIVAPKPRRTSQSLQKEVGLAYGALRLGSPHLLATALSPQSSEADLPF
jgi:hypothetical protein